MGQYYGSMVSVKENFGFRCNKKNMYVQKPALSIVYIVLLLKGMNLSRRPSGISEAIRGYSWHHKF